MSSGPIISTARGALPNRWACRATSIRAMRWRRTASAGNACSIRWCGPPTAGSRCAAVICRSRCLGRVGGRRCRIGWRCPTRSPRPCCLDRSGPFSVRQRMKRSGSALLAARCGCGSPTAAILCRSTPAGIRARPGSGLIAGWKFRAITTMSAAAFWR